MARMALQMKKGSEIVLVDPDSEAQENFSGLGYKPGEMVDLDQIVPPPAPEPEKPKLDAEGKLVEQKLKDVAPVAMSQPKAKGKAKGKKG